MTKRWEFHVIHGSQVRDHLDHLSHHIFLRNNAAEAQFAVCEDDALLDRRCRWNRLHTNPLERFLEERAQILLSGRITTNELDDELRKLRNVRFLDLLALIEVGHDGLGNLQLTAHWNHDLVVKLVEIQHVHLRNERIHLIRAKRLHLVRILRGFRQVRLPLLLVDQERSKPFTDENSLRKASRASGWTIARSCLLCSSNAL